MSTIASQSTSLTIVYSTVYSAVDQRKQQSSASLAFGGGGGGGGGIRDSSVTDEFPVPRATNAESVYIWWHHHMYFKSMQKAILLGACFYSYTKLPCSMLIQWLMGDVTVFSMMQFSSLCGE